MQKLLKPLLAVKTKSGYSIFTAVLVTLFSTWVVFDATKAEVVIAADGDVQTVKTHTTTVGELLQDLGIDVGKHDELSHGENTEIVDGMEITLDSANKILLTIDGKTETYHSSAQTVGQLFHEEGLTFTEHDEVSHNNIAVIKDDIEIEVKKAFPIVVNDGGKNKELWTTGGTVKQLLQKKDIGFKRLDKNEPSLDEELTKDMRVKITSVEKKTKEITETILLQTEEKNDSTLKKDTNHTNYKGEEGKEVRTNEIILENGKEAKHELIAEDNQKESKNKIVAIGTKEEQNKVVSSGNKASTKPSGGKEFRMVATAYGPDCKGCSGRSATGMNLKQTPTPKVIAVDPSVIPLGTRVWVEGYGEAIAADTGGSIKGNRIDVLFQSEAYALNNW